MAKKDQNSKEDGSSPSAADTGSASRFFVIGVGAAATATDSLEALLKARNSFRDAALVVVFQHREALAEEWLETFASASGGELVTIKDRMAIEPNCTYVASEGMRVTVSGDHFRLRTATEVPGGRGIVDSFLVSLAEEATERAIGVVMAGMGGDGTLGLIALKEKGGLALAERAADEDEHAEPDPQSAASIADVVAPVEQLALRIQSHLASQVPEKTAKSFDEVVAVWCIPDPHRHRAAQPHRP